MAQRRAELQAMVALGAEEVRRLQRTEHVARQQAYRARSRGRQTVSDGARVLAGLMFLISGDQRMVEVYLLTQLRADTETEACGRVEGIRGVTSELLASVKTREAAEKAWGGGDPAAVLRAANLVAEVRCLTWLMQHNMRVVTVLSSQLICRFRRFWPAACRSRRSFSLLLRLRHMKAQRAQWARSFRRRWHVGWRRLHHAMLLPPEEAAARAGGSRPSGSWAGQCRGRLR